MQKSAVLSDNIDSLIVAGLNDELSIGRRIEVEETAILPYVSNCKKEILNTFRCDHVRVSSSTRLMVNLQVFCHLDQER